MLQGAVSVAWNGTDWGVAWTEAQGPEPAVYFVRVGTEGRRRGTPVRVSERGYRGWGPSLVWNGESWVVGFAGGAARLGEIWLARVDARGTPIGRPQRVTARERDDHAPALGYDGRELFAIWSAFLPALGRHAVYVLRMNRWGGQLGPPLRLVDRRDRLSAPALVRTRSGWAAAWLVSRSDAVAVDMRRIDPDGEPRAYVSRVTLGALGGSDLTARFGVAWDGERFGVAWDEVRDGAPHVFFHTVSARLDESTPARILSLPNESSSAPALAALGPGSFVAAWQIERAGEQRVRLLAFDASGTPFGEPVEVQGHDGRAGSPALSLGRDALGLVTAAGGTLSFHRVGLGPCVWR